MARGSRGTRTSDGAPAALPFVQLEFAHAVGIPPGLYLASAPAPRGDALSGVGEADTLISEVVQAPAELPPLLGRRRGRDAPAATPADRAATPPPVPLAVLTLVLATESFADVATAAATLEAWAGDPDECELLVERALAVVNRGVRAYRTAAGDPYVSEVMALDPRAIRIGFGVPGGIGASRWLGAHTLPAATTDPAAGPSVGELRIVERVAAALAGRLLVFEAEDLALRALLDLNHGRLRGAAAQANAAVALLCEELADDGVDTSGVGVAACAGREEIEATALHVLETAAAFHEARLRCAPTAAGFPAGVSPGG